MNRTEKRYYKVGEKVFVKELKAIGEIKELNIQPKQNIYKATVEVSKVDGDATIITKREYDLWEIDKNKRTLFKMKRKSTPTILFAKMSETAKIPTKEVENAGYDIYANFEQDFIVLNKNSVKLIPTGIASSVTDDWALIVKERGSTGVKGMSVRAGVVDSGYRGEIFVAINNTSEEPIIIVKKGATLPDWATGVELYPYEKAIAQLLLVPVPKTYVKEIPYEELKAIPSSRKEGSLGSSNK
jgi:dUTP pyrophosphatase